jgi:tRNA A-37 threonylcarbamoyl transferase component Bud32
MTDELDHIRSTLSGSYAVERELGRGGMATVYLATDLKHERKVAIKVLRSELAAAVGHDRFLREIKTTAQLSNPHILPLLDSGDAGGSLFYVMPFVEGESLRDRLNRDKQLPLDATIEIACDVAAALSYAHGRGVIHRDIKPENIMLSAGEAIVADFGIAKAVTTAAGDNLTSTGLAVGTPAYMSPEQSTGSEELDARTDTYSLGTVVFEMLAGEPPYTGPNPQSVIAKRLTGAVPHVTTVRDVPEGVDGAIRKALARAPADRWATTAEFSAALRGERMATKSYATSPAGARRTARLVGVGIGLAAMLALLVLLWPKLFGAHGARPSVVRMPAGMVLVQGGTYSLFGGGCAKNCLPARSVPIDSFYMDSTEVTVGAYRAFAAAHNVPVPWITAAPVDLPITRVMWREADAFCRARDALTQLPTEEQWEAAARGHDNRAFPWGNTWSSGNANADGAQTSVVAVGSFAHGVSPSGALDMSGNVWEWTATAGPIAGDSARAYVIRGGAYNTPAANATTFFRGGPLPAAVAENLRASFYGQTGFRCVHALR